MAEDQELMKENYGNPLPYDKNFRGPQWRNRSCTDVPCLFIFIIFLAAWGFIANYAIRNGDLNKIMVPTDSFNRKCGLDSQVLDKKYLFFFNLTECIDPLVPITGCPTQQVCVKQCPTETFVWDTMKDKLPFNELKKRLICLSDADYNQINSLQEATAAIETKRCASFYVKSAPFLNRCIWEFSPEVCNYIPSFLLQRSRRGVSYNVTTLNPELEAEVEAMALTMQDMQPRNSAGNSKQLEPIIQCRRNSEQSETVIKEKMLKIDSRLSKLVGNMVSYFYNGTHDSQQMGEAIVEDILSSWYIILTALFITLVASFIFIALLRWLAGPLLWTSILGVLIGMIVGTYYSVRQYMFWRNTPTVPNHSPNFQAAVKNVLQEQNTWLYLSIFLSACFIIIFLLVIVLRKRIKIAIALTKEGSKAVSCVKSTVFFPLFSWLLYIMVIIYAIGVALYLGSIGEPAFRMVRQLDDSSLQGVTQENCICDGPAQLYKVGDSCEPVIFEHNCYVPQNALNGFLGQNKRTPCSQTSCSFVNIKNPTIVNWFFGYNVFGFFWLTFFISAFSDMVLAATFATWYWTFKKKDVPYFTLTRAFRQTAFYHLGTLAFGSLILAICRIIRLILEYIYAKVKKYDNAVTRSIMCCCRCFFWLLESFLRFLNRNAYIMCAIHGKNFCSSAKDSFNLIMRNFLRVVTLDKVTDFIFFLSKLLLTGAAGVATYYFCAKNLINRPLHYNAVPTTIVVIGAFLITSVFFGVYNMAVDTLFLCFLEDCERNDGTPEKPYYMSKQLMKILGKRNKRPISNDKRR